MTAPVQFSRKPSAGIVGAPVPKDYLTIGASQTLDLSTADHHFGILGANVTLTMSVVSNPDRTTVRLYLTQDGTGSRTVTWAGVTWLSGITPTLQTGAAALDTFEFTFIASTTAPTWLGRQLGKTINANTTGSSGSVIAALTPGSFLTPSDTYNGSVARTFNVDATSAATASKVVSRDANGRTGLVGVIFPSTAVPSADPNTLDDYEEGTWTPTRNGFTEVIGGGSITQGGAYTKIGNVVIISAFLACAGGATIAATSATSFLSGLPFTVGSIDGIGEWFNAASGSAFGAVYANSTNLIIITSWAATSGFFEFTATYRV